MYSPKYLVSKKIYISNIAFKLKYEIEFQRILDRREKNYVNTLLIEAAEVDLNFNKILSCLKIETVRHCPIYILLN